jgi:hypothetical protein
MQTLSWRIPTSGDPRLLRIALAQVGLASIVAALILVVAAPREWLVPALIGLIPLAIFMAYRRWHAYQRSMAGADNVRIDDAGVHWIDGAGQERTFRRDEVVSYSIGRDQNTLRPVPSLTLHLGSGFESQPIELHPPANPEALRDILSGVWSVAEQEPPSSIDTAQYDEAVAVYSECHDDFHEWHWEGTKAELSRFFSLFAAAANELTPPPIGAKPKERIIIASRRQSTRLHLAHAPIPHFEPDLIAAPADILRNIAAQAASVLSVDNIDAKFNVELGPKDAWTFHLHVLDS